MENPKRDNRVCATKFYPGTPTDRYLNCASVNEKYVSSVNGLNHIVASPHFQMRIEFSDFDGKK